MSAIYNEIDPVACAVLRHLSNENIIAPGLVVERSIKDIHDLDLIGAVQFHAFAGSGLWSVAARLAGWPDDRSLWSGSCPCQGWSTAGKRKGFEDSRDLWPDFFRLIAACRPPVVVGEITSGSAIYPWFDRTASDLESVGYACRAVDLPACAVDAPHRRNRLWWVALADAQGRGQQWQLSIGGEARRSQGGDLCAVADADGGGHRGRQEDPQRAAQRRDVAERPDGAMGDAASGGGARLSIGSIENVERGTLRDEGASAGPADHRSFWMDAEWLQCADGKARRARSPVRLLVDGLVGRAHLWRLVGNSIVPQLAAEVLKALKDEIDSRE